MPWTASINNISNNQGNAQVVVSYTNGINTLNETYLVASPTQLKQTAINRIAQLQAVDDFVSTTTPGPLDTSVPAPVTPPPPTQAQIDQQTFIADITLYKQYKLAIGYGLMIAADPAVTTLVSKIKAEFIPAYAPLLN
jgi:hypothetical protein